jgi:hypothetical protein
LGTRKRTFSAMATKVGMASWYVNPGPSKRSRRVGFDHEFEVLSGRYFSDWFSVDIFRVALHMFGTPETTTIENGQQVERGRSATSFDFDVAKIELRGGPHRISVSGGLGFRSPTGPYRRTGTSTASSGPVETVPLLWGQYTYGANIDEVTQRARNGESSVLFAGGLWSRISPSGLAVDSGYLGTGSWLRSMAKFDLRLDASVGHARRVLVANDAMSVAPDITGVGKQFWFGRGSAQLQKSFGLGLSGRLELWVERSDRDNPQAAASVDGAAKIAAGGQASLVWQRVR